MGNIRRRVPERKKATGSEKTHGTARPRHAKGQERQRDVEIAHCGSGLTVPDGNGTGLADAARTDISERGIRSIHRPGQAPSPSTGITSDCYGPPKMDQHPAQHAKTRAREGSQQNIRPAHNTGDSNQRTQCSIPKKTRTAAYIQLTAAQNALRRTAILEIGR